MHKTRTKAGKQFMEELSRSWNIYRHTSAGQRLIAEAKSNAARKKDLRSALKRSEEALLAVAASASEASLACEMGFGDRKNLVFLGAVCAMAHYSCQAHQSVYEVLLAVGSVDQLAHCGLHIRPVKSGIPLWFAKMPSNISYRLRIRTSGRKSTRRFKR